MRISDSQILFVRPLLVLVALVLTGASYGQSPETPPSQLIASDDRHHGGEGIYVPPQTTIDYVPVKKTRWEEVEQEYYVESTDSVIYKVAPKKSVEISSIDILPDNFLKNENSGEWMEGLTLTGQFQQRIEYDKDTEIDPGKRFDPISVQVQVLSSDEKQKSSVISRNLDVAKAVVDRRADPNNASRIIETRTFNLAAMAPIFIPYYSLRSVLFVGPRGTLMRMLVVEVCLVDGMGNLVIGPAGPICFRRTLTINSFFLPTWLPPIAPFPTVNPGVLITNVIVPMPWLPGWRPGGFVRTGGVRTVGTGNRPPRRGTTLRPPTTGPTGPTGPSGAVSGAGPSQGGTPSSSGPSGTTDTGKKPPRVFTASTEGILAATGEGQIIEATEEVFVPSKKMVVYWFSLPEKEGNRHEIVLSMKNRSLGVALAVLSVVPEKEIPELQQSKELIEALDYVSETLETEKPVEMRTLDLAEQVSDIPFEERTYILVFAAPTLDDNTIDVQGLPPWAVKQVLEKKTDPMKFETEFRVASN